MPNQARTAREIFNDAVENVPPDQWAEFLGQECKDNPSMRERVQRLLDAHGDMGHFMERPAAEPSPTIDTRLSGKPGMEIGPYTIREKIGEGGFGVVYVAEQSRPVRRRVALKVIKPGMDTKEVVARFEAERQALALMNHPNVARVLDAGSTDTGRPYFVMELVHGLPITEFCDKNKLPTRERLDLFVTICQAVHHAHQKGIIHRDLKPSNIMVTLHDGTPVPKVIDFGVAKALSQQLTEKTIYTHYGQVVGTPQYMSPEQAEMSDLGIDTRSDIYSLGVVLYELLTGTSPVDKKRLLASGYAEMMRIIREEEPPRPSKRISTLGQEATMIAQQRRTNGKKLSRSLRGELDWIVMQSLEKDRERRYDTAANLAADVKRFLENEPVQACPPTTTYRIKKFTHRHKATVFSGVAITVLLVLCMITTSSGWIAERRARQEIQDRQREVVRERNLAEAARKEETLQRQIAVQERRKAENQRRLSEQLHYAGQIRLAQSAIESENLGEASRILHSCLDTSTDVSRGWEWYYLLQRAKRDELATLVGHSDQIWDLAWAPDSQRFATASRDGVRVWSAESKNQIQVLDGFGSRADKIAWAPNANLLAVGLSIGEVHIFDGQSFRRRGVLKTHGFRGRLAFAHHGQLIASSSGRTLSIWDWQTSDQTASIVVGDGEISQILWSPKDNRIAIFTRQSCEVRSIESTRPPLQLDANGTGIWSPDGRVIVAQLGRTPESDSSQGIGFFDARTGELLRKVPRHLTRGSNLAWSPNGAHIATASGTAIEIWDSNLGSRERTLRGHTDRVTNAMWSPNGEYFVSVGRDYTARIWKTVPEATSNVMRGHEGAVQALAASPDGVVVASGGSDNTVRIWDVVSSECLHVFNGHSDKVNGVAWCPDGRYVASASSDKTIRVWDVLSGKLHTHLQHDSQVLGVAWNPQNSNQLVSSCWDGQCQLWDVNSSERLRSFSEHIEVAHTAGWDGDGRYVASLGSRDLWVWEASTGNAVFHTSLGGGGGFFSKCFVRFSPDNRRLVWSAQNVVSLLALDERHDVQILDSHSEAVTDATWIPSGQRLATSGNDGTCRVWDVDRGTELLRLRGHSGAIRSIGWSSTSQALLTGGDDGDIRTWSAADGFQLAKNRELLAAHSGTGLWRARRMMNGGNLVEAVSAFTTLVESDSKSWRLLRERGELYVKLQEWANAAADFEQAISLAPEREKVGVLYFDAIVRLQLGDYDAYIDDCRELVRSALKSSSEGQVLDTAWVCALHPNTIREIAEAATLYDRVAGWDATAIPITSHSEVVSKGQVKQLWIRLRRGQFKEALEPQIEYTFTPLNDRQLEGLVSLVKTAASIQNGDAEKAKQTFARATEIRSLGNRQAAYWMYDVTFDILYHEVQELIE